MNDNYWRIPELVLPNTKAIPMQTIEIDPRYN